MAEHVTFFRAKAQPGKLQSVIDQFEKWDREQKPEAKGFKFSTLVRSLNDQDEFMGAVHWDNSDNYYANAQRQGQDAWYQEFRALLVDDPVWFDGSLVLESRA